MGQSRWIKIFLRIMVTEVKESSECRQNWDRGDQSWVRMGESGDNNIGLMQLICQYREKMLSVMQHYAFHSNQTQKYYAQDNSAALAIQTKFRMYIKRKQYLKMRRAAIEIETLYRSYSASKNFKLRNKAELQRRDLEFYNQQATLIQKTFRGYYSRRYGETKDLNDKAKENIHNYYKRKEQLEELKRKNIQFKKELEEYGERERLQDEDRKMQTAKNQFNNLAKNLHHLSSTKGIPGVYNSPFASNKPVAFDAPVEDHLKKVFTSEYKWRPPSKAEIMKYSIKMREKSIRKD